MMNIPVHPENNAITTFSKKLLIIFPHFVKTIFRHKNREVGAPYPRTLFYFFKFVELRKNKQCVHNNIIVTLY